jgi:formylglycine-generating enzyme required for sulfatase activity
MKKIKTAMGAIVALVLQGCEQSAERSVPASAPNSPAELQQFIQAIKQNLVFVEGGEFLMGDFGPQYAPERAPYDRDKDSKPLHKVELSSYSISRFKATNAEFQFYLRYNNLKLREKGMAFKSKWDSINSTPDTPAHVDWFEADKYCNWLASITSLPFALPSEAQWEYAARSRG